MTEPQTASTAFANDHHIVAAPAFVIVRDTHGGTPAPTGTPEAMFPILDALGPTPGVRTVAPLGDADIAGLSVVTLDRADNNWREELRHGCVQAGRALADVVPAAPIHLLLADAIIDDDPAWTLRTAFDGLQHGAERRIGDGNGTRIDVAHPPGFDVAADSARMVGDVIAWVRHLVDCPPNALGPEEFVTAVSKQIVDAHSLTMTVWDEERLVAEGCGGMLAVASGSARPARLVIIERHVNDSPETVLIGKGVTFDSGGLSVKNDITQTWMKADMGGAAAVAGAVVASELLNLQANVTAIIPLAENLSGSRAYRPGDVVSHPTGRTTEVTNTDAEGRLLLADALSLAAARKPAAIIDVATLTSAVLGDRRWFTVANDDALARALVAAGEAVGDPGWQLPLVTAYAEDLASQVADGKHHSFDHAGHDHLLAPVFLSMFVGDVPWAHMDVVGTAYRPGDRPFGPAGATGSPTSAIVRYLESQGSAGRNVT